jgi:UDP-N-acetylmuramoyl-L-alanyl-D-glutamate--2,6-diaminopimelate ligase
MDESVSSRIKDLQWKAQESTYDSLLFYRIGKNEQAQKDFSERMKKTNFAWLVTNQSHPEMPKNSCVIPDSQWNPILKQLLDVLFPMPDLKLLALTGTNGKSTTTDLVLQLGELAGYKGISIGTLGVRENHRTLLDFGLTSPGYIDLRKFLFRFGPGKDFCVLEASSHALEQDRLYDLSFASAGWLSFTQDHLDYHKTMEAYFEAKAIIFKKLLPSAHLFVPEEQSSLYQRLIQVSSQTKQAPAISGVLPLFFSTRFNRNNLEVAMAMVEDVFGVRIPNRFEELNPPDGRFFIRPYGSNFIVVDFAHTPDALENICSGIRSAFPEHKLKVLFGCGGDRDRGKRPLMAQIVEKWAHEIIVTSDNPRTENPEQIIDDIVKGLKAQNFKRITNRPEAVKEAFHQLKEKEILLLAGKGHEDYILINGVKHPYSDIQEVENFLAGNP